MTRSFHHDLELLDTPVGKRATVEQSHAGIPEPRLAERGGEEEAQTQPSETKTAAEEAEEVGQGEVMSLGKIRALKERGQQFHGNMTKEIDRLMGRYDDLDRKLGAAVGKHDAYLDSAERDVDDNEHAVAELSNLPLDGANSGDASKG